MPGSDALAPLVHLVAPPGTGKTTVLPALVARAEGWVVMDLDEILVDGRLLGVLIADPAAAAVWPAYNDLWATICGFVRRAGHPVLLLGQVPDDGELGPGERLIGWEIDADLRRARLRARGWSAEQIADADADADLLRTLVGERLVHTPRDASPGEIAELLWRAVRALR